LTLRANIALKLRSIVGLLRFWREMPSWIVSLAKSMERSRTQTPGMFLEATRLHTDSNSATLSLRRYMLGRGDCSHCIATDRRKSLARALICAAHPCLPAGTLEIKAHFKEFDVPLKLTSDKKTIN